MVKWGTAAELLLMTRWIYEASLLISKGTHNTVLFSENSTETPIYTHQREQTDLFERDRKPDDTDCLNVMPINKLDLHRSASSQRISARRWIGSRALVEITVGNMVPAQSLIPLSFYWDSVIPSDWSGACWSHHEGYRRIEGPPANSKIYIYFAWILQEPWLHTIL